MRKLGLFLCLLILFGCTNSLAFPEDNSPFIEYEYGNYGPDSVFNLYSTKIIFNGNGTGQITTSIDKEIGIDENAPYTVDFKIDNQAVKSLQHVIEDSDFFVLSEDLSQIDAVDGGYQYITVHTTEETKTLGGSNLDEETIEILSEQILEMIPDNQLEIFHERIREYQRDILNRRK